MISGSRKTNGSVKVFAELVEVGLTFSTCFRTGALVRE